MIHVAAHAVEAEGRLRQRCAWCGALILDQDVAVDPTTWPMFAYVRVDAVDGERITEILRVLPGPEGYVPVPADCCLALDPAVTM